MAYTALPQRANHLKTAQAPESLGSTSISSDNLSKSDKTNKAEKHEKNEPRQWAYISDTVVRLTTLDEVLKSKAYMCLYERIS